MGLGQDHPCKGKKRVRSIFFSSVPYQKLPHIQRVTHELSFFEAATGSGAGMDNDMWWWGWRWCRTESCRATQKQRKMVVEKETKLPKGGSPASASQAPAPRLGGLPPSHHHFPAANDLVNRIYREIGRPTPKMYQKSCLKTNGSQMDHSFGSATSMG
jgi:hypothetical protein